MDEKHKSILPSGIESVQDIAYIKKYTLLNKINGHKCIENKKQKEEV